jgi:hypothetical protein
VDQELVAWSHEGPRVFASCVGHLPSLHRNGNISLPLPLIPMLLQHERALPSSPHPAVKSRIEKVMQNIPSSYFMKQINYLKLKFYSVFSKSQFATDEYSPLKECYSLSSMKADGEVSEKEIERGC